MPGSPTRRSRAATAGRRARSPPTSGTRPRRSAWTRRGRLGRLVRWRIPDTPADLRFTDLFARYPFAVLDEGPDWSISGLCGPIWTSARDYARIDVRTFREWTRPGTVRVLFGHWVEEDDAGSALVSEARVAPTDRFARLQLRALWLLVRRFERVIGSEPLPLAVARAEAVTP